MSTTEFPEALFAGDATLDFSGQYLSASADDVAVRRFSGRTAVRDLLRSTPSLTYPPTTGARVAFSTSIEALMSYPNPPAGGSVGTVITVRTASGDVNHHEGMVFVRWDDGRMMQVYANHIRPSTGRQRIADAVSQRIAGLGDLTEFFKVAKDTLVHKSTKDLWSLKKVGEEFVIERLFDETGDPLKG
jgi:hypothetical protein